MEKEKDKMPRDPSVAATDGVSASRGRELDDFWDVGRLVPTRTTQPARPSRSPRPTPTAVEVELAPPPARTESAVGGAPLTLTASLTQTQTRSLTQTRTETQTRPEESVPVGTGPLTGTGRGQAHYVPPHTATEGEEIAPEDDYIPDGLLLHRVQVLPWRSNYHYFDPFAQDTIRYAAMRPPEGMEVRREAFFSFFPQYAQLNRRQLAWYLFWRDKVRGGCYPDTDYAYLLLYFFELINLPAPGEEAVRLRDHMADVWMAYRKAFPQLDHYMCEWLCDFCLLHRLPAPVDRLAPALDEIIRIAQLKEFYLTVAVAAGREPTPEGGDAPDLAAARILLRHCCQYDYRKSKFASGEHGALFDRIIPAGVASVLPFLLGKDGEKPMIQLSDSSMTRDAYTGALCAYRNKRRIVVSYTSFSRSHEMRFLIGDMVKHLENRLRGWIGVRSRLSVMALPPPIREALDAYLAPLAPAHPAPPPQKPAPRPAYEAMYDLPRKAVSLADADAIEKDSWHTTRILTEAFEWPEEATAAEAVVPPVQEAVEENAEVSVAVREEETEGSGPDNASEAGQTSEAPPAPSDSPLARRLGNELCAFIRLALSGDGAGQRAFARAHHTMPDALADRVNGVTTDYEIFDMILDDAGDGTYLVLDEYRALVRALLGDAE